MKKISIGILGCGTIGSSLAKQLQKKYSKHVRIAYISDHSPEKAVRLNRKLSPKAKGVSTSVLIAKSDLIIECAGVEAGAWVASESLRLGKTALIMSVGGLLKLPASKLKKSKKGALLVPSGAIAGLDALMAARESKIKKVSLVTRKPPKGLKGAPYFKTHAFPKLRGFQEKRVFQGSAKQAVKAFPQNINVAALLSLGGVGPSKTRVEIWTSKKYKTNQHEVTIEGDFGKIETKTSNKPAPSNPKTSYLAVLSALATLRKYFDQIRIGT